MKNPRLLQTSKNMLAAIAVTGLLAGSVARVQASPASNGGSNQFGTPKGQMAADSDSSKHDCKGQNSCKGQGGCKTGGAV